MPAPHVMPVDANDNVLGSSASPQTVTVSGGTVATNAPNASSIYTEAAQSRTTNGNTTANTWPLNANQCFVSVNVTGFAGGTNLVVSIQQADGNGNYVTIGSSASITQLGVYGFSVGQGMTNGNMIAGGFGYRFSWALQGTFTTLTFQISAQAR